MMPAKNFDQKKRKDKTKTRGFENKEDQGGHERATIKEAKNTYFFGNKRTSFGNKENKLREQNKKEQVGRAGTAPVNQHRREPAPTAYIPCGNSKFSKDQAVGPMPPPSPCSDRVSWLVLPRPTVDKGNKKKNPSTQATR